MNDPTAAPPSTMARLRLIGGVVLATTSLVVLLAAVRYVNALPEGLRGDYYTTADWTGNPALSSVDSQPSTSRIPRAWGGPPPEVFSVYWRGSLLVPHGGTYTFGIT